MRVIAELTSFEVLYPEFKLSQADSLQWLVDFHEKRNPSGDPKKLHELFSRFGVKPNRVQSRLFETSALLDSQWESIGTRTEFFQSKCIPIFQKFYPKHSSRPAHILHVSCTGYASPSAAQRLVNFNRWYETQVTHAYHMGCYAALPSIRIAEALVSTLAERTQSARVDLVHTEMCSLHLNPTPPTPEQMVVQSLFGDGHIKYTAVPAGAAKSGFSILNIQERVIPDSWQSMGWSPESWGMRMTLSRDVPAQIQSSVKPFLEELIQPTGLSLAEVLKNGVFAVHPGGPKIIDSVQTLLELSDSQVQASKNVLFQRGNMSSATLPHIWKEILDQGVEAEKIIVSLAFGPGLTIFGSIFKLI